MDRKRKSQFENIMKYLPSKFYSHPDQQGILRRLLSHKAMLTNLYDINESLKYQKKIKAPFNRENTNLS